MNNNDNGYLKAQRAYDNQLPPEGDEYEDCSTCEGTGTFEYSNCCGANIIMGDICEKCKEHCNKELCDQCEGTGQTNSTLKAMEMREEYLERKAEEAREEQSLEMPKYPHNIDINSDRYSGLGECRDNE